jgi:hypothetical protein
MYPFLRPFLNRGGAGFSLTRAKTAERIDPLVRRHFTLLRAYGIVIERLHNREHAEALRRGMTASRIEAAKLREIMWSVGGNTTSGLELPPPDMGADDSEMIHRLNDMERDYRAALQEELKLNHQIRTQAALEVNLEGSERRIQALYPIVSRTRRTSIR